MKIENSIGWCDETTNAVTGCDKVSLGCKNCYAAVGTRVRVLRHRGIETWGPKGVRHPVAQFAQKIRRLNKLCICDTCHEAKPFRHLTLPSPRSSGGEGGAPSACECGGTLRRIRLFADSNSDWLDEKWPIAVFANFLNELRLSPNVDKLLLTKRAENWRDRVCQAMEYMDRNWLRGKEAARCECGTWLGGWLEAASPHRGMASTPPNVWLGVSVENQAMADLRIPQLLAIPAAVRFLSCEPLLEGVDLNAAIVSAQTVYATKREADSHLLHWVIVGGESGKDRRDCGVEPIVNIAEQCRQAGVACYVKQDCAFKSGEQGRIPAEVWGLKQFPMRHLTAETAKSTKL